MIVRLSGVMVGYVRVALQGSDCEIGADLAPEFQGRGLAKPIYLALLESWAEPLGIRTLYLRVLRSNRRAFKLYESMNFRVEEETTMDFGMRVDLDDALKALDAQLRRGQE